MQEDFCVCAKATVWGKNSYSHGDRIHTEHGIEEYFLIVIHRHSPECLTVPLSTLHILLAKLKFVGAPCGAPISSSVFIQSAVTFRAAATGSCSQTVAKTDSCTQRKSNACSCEASNQAKARAKNCTRTRADDGSCPIWSKAEATLNLG